MKSCTHGLNLCYSLSFFKVSWAQREEELADIILCCLRFGGCWHKKISKLVSIFFLTVFSLFFFDVLVQWDKKKVFCCAVQSRGPLKDERCTFEHFSRRIHELLRSLRCNSYLRIQVTQPNFFFFGKLCFMSHFFCVIFSKKVCTLKNGLIVEYFFS